jgi:DNA transformation protein and related proteins
MSEYVEYLKEVLEEFGPVTLRKMFGGYGVYYKGLMFALVSDDTLYLKADEKNSVYFRKAGLSQFEYNKNGKVVKLSYYQAPDEIMENHEEAAIWAQRSYAAALRAQKQKSSMKKMKMEH